MWMATELYDLVRIDHFRGFAANWAVKAGEKTAIKGKWVRGPGAALFDAIAASLGTLIAEDLGVITPDVEELRDRFNFPGMRVLQFAFDNPANIDKPYNYIANSCAYTGTHDNDTTRGWWAGLDEGTRARVGSRLHTADEAMPWSLVRLALSSTARLAVVPAQDLLELDARSRMNTPGTEGGNWQWQATAGGFDEDLALRLRGLVEEYDRSTS